ncbi:DUF6884 domain-containing protein [Arthrobacter sp. KBS0702]|uniref:DUF6884 domain-containing protein n=1 Tax=Arthrobacter sp. KBS0702 TaxID=2578107 RepID=UPI0037C09037
MFKKASAYAELTCDRWYILSAKHGLLHPDEIIQPYDMRLGTNHPTSPPASETSSPSNSPTSKTLHWSAWRMLPQ